MSGMCYNILANNVMLSTMNYDHKEEDDKMIAIDKVDSIEP